MSISNSLAKLVDDQIHSFELSSVVFENIIIIVSVLVYLYVDVIFVQPWNFFSVFLNLVFIGMKWWSLIFFSIKQKRDHHSGS